MVSSAALQESSSSRSKSGRQKCVKGVEQTQSEKDGLMQQVDWLIDGMKEWIWLKTEELSYIKGRFMVEAEELEEKILIRLDQLKKAMYIYHDTGQKMRLMSCSKKLTSLWNEENY